MLFPYDSPLNTFDHTTSHYMLRTLLTPCCIFIFCVDVSLVVPVVVPAASCAIIVFQC